MLADPALIDFVSGSMAGFSCKVLEYPFDTVKTLLQCDREVRCHVGRMPSCDCRSTMLLLLEYFNLFG